ncbi:MAG: META domain-containing protein [Rikenellaceae bacterium]|jgi:heat shock protein HslJ|nr:META domain-containing protein [Rikenellaceae bacterium]
MKLRTLFLLASATALLGSCCNCRKLQQANAKPLVGTEWRLTQLDGKEVAGSSEKFCITISQDSRITGKGDCNRISGSVSMFDAVKRAGPIKIDQLVSTKAFCLDQTTETKFCKALQEADNYKLDIYMLLLYKGKDLLAVLEADKWK